MAWAVIVARSFVGLVFLVFGLNYFLAFVPIPFPPEGTPAALFLGMIHSSGYLTAVKVLEILGAVNLLSGRFAPLGIAILLPIALNILFYEIFLLKGPGPGALLVPMLLFVLYGYRSTVRRVFDGTARVDSSGAGNH
jgi:uncharacterized membrane protein YphA (DoxX/SURF4 family)